MEIYVNLKGVRFCDCSKRQEFLLAEGTSLHYFRRKVCCFFTIRRTFFCETFHGFLKTAKFYAAKFNSFKLFSKHQTPNTFTLKLNVRFDKIKHWIIFTENKNVNVVLPNHDCFDLLLLFLLPKINVRLLNISA